MPLLCRYFVSLTWIRPRKPKLGQFWHTPTIPVCQYCHYSPVITIIGPFKHMFAGLLHFRPHSTPAPHSNRAPHSTPALTLLPPPSPLLPLTQIPPLTPLPLLTALPPPPPLHSHPSLKSRPSLHPAPPSIHAPYLLTIYLILRGIYCGLTLEYNRDYSSPHRKC